MFKFKKSKSKKSELYVTPGENVRDAIIQAAEDSGYAAKIINVFEHK